MFDTSDLDYFFSQEKSPIKNGNVIYEVSQWRETLSKINSATDKQQYVKKKSEDNKVN